MSAATVPFLFNFAPSHTAVYFPWNIDGGTIASTLAGEFSFSLALTFALLFLGVFIYSLRTGRYRWLAALLFALTLLCHIIPGLFAGGAAVIITVARGERRGITTLAVVGVLGALVAAFWLLPFAAYLDYSSSMNFGRVGDVYAQLFPANGEQAVQWIAAAGLAVAVWRRRPDRARPVRRGRGERGGLLLAPLGTRLQRPVAALLVPRHSAARRLRHRRTRAHRLRGAGAGVAQPGVHRDSSARRSPSRSSPPGSECSRSTRPGGSVNPVDSWATWNYSGYQAKPGWPEFRRVIAMLEREAKAHGCGRLDYEYSPNTTDAFGSTDVPMSFPLWTNGCIDSAEGLYYESSTSNDFHFLDQAELSLQASNPVVGLPYRSLDVADGIRHLQLTGVKYFLADSPTVEADAARDRALVAVASTPESPDVVDGNTTEVSSHPRWVLYLIRDSALVVPLHYEPIVEAGLTKTQWQVTTAIAWYQDLRYWPVPIVSGGPASWPHAELRARCSSRRRHAGSRPRPFRTSSTRTRRSRSGSAASACPSW